MKFVILKYGGVFSASRVERGTAINFTVSINYELIILGVSFNLALN